MIKFEFTLSDVDASNLISILHDEKIRSLEKGQTFISANSCPGGSTMKVRVTPRRVFKSGQGMSGLPRDEAIALHAAAIARAGEECEVVRRHGSQHLCDLADGTQLHAWDLTEIHEPSEENVNFCKEFVKRLDMYQMTKTKVDLRTIVVNGVPRAVEGMWETCDLYQLYKEDSVMRWVYIFVRDNQRCFTDNKLLHITS